MERNVKSSSQEKQQSIKIQSPHEVFLKDRNQLKMTGIVEVISATSNAINCKTENGPLVISGHDLRVNLLDIESKVVEVVGDIDDLKYVANKKSFLQRVFK